MRAAILKDSDSELAIEEVPDPEPSDDELLVRVRGSSVNAIDAYEATGALQGTKYEFPVTGGTDFSGVVERAGSAVTRHRPGDEVFGLRQNPGRRDGTWAELIVVGEDHPFLAPKPERIELAQAGAAPLAAVTALALLEPLELSDGDTMLIVGGTGGVGSFAIQIARARGAEVVAPGLPEDEEYLRGLGAEVVDRAGDVAAAVRERHPDGVDALVDVVSRDPGNFDSNVSALGEDGRGSSPLGAAGENAGRFNVGGTSDPARLPTLADLLDSGAVRVPVQRAYVLAGAGDAVSDFLASHIQGKLAIEIG
jgi:NADPH:quinone reductase-like Zn-dependent oxidoreductase